MLLLVLAGNFVLLTVGWAFVGFASYALISFWYRRTTATAAGMKAFVINVVGDIGLVLAALLIFREIGSFEFGTVFARAPQVFSTNEWTITAICLLLLVGAFAKSAQLPLHTWLPDAMEGPTPVSALIHAATMVTAGVYLIARTHVLFELAPTAADVAAFVGLATLLVAGTIALVVTDLKRMIAYSTMSQIGYMIMGVSIGAYSRRPLPPDDPCLLQGAALHGGRLDHRGDGEPPGHRPDERLRRAMRFTSAMLVIGGLALAAFPGTSGFFSKDEILCLRRSARRAVRVDGDRLGYVGALPDRDLHLPADLPGAARQAVPRGPGADRHGPALPRRAREPGDRRGRGRRRRLPRRPSTTSPSGPGRWQWRWRRSRPARCSPG